MRLAWIRSISRVSHISLIALAWIVLLSYVSYQGTTSVCDGDNCIAGQQIPLGVARLNTGSIIDLPRGSLCANSCNAARRILETFVNNFYKNVELQQRNATCERKENLWGYSLCDIDVTESTNAFQTIKDDQFAYQVGTQFVKAFDIRDQKFTYHIYDSFMGQPLNTVQNYIDDELCPILDDTRTCDISDYVVLAQQSLNTVDVASFDYRWFTLFTEQLYLYREFAVKLSPTLIAAAGYPYSDPSSRPLDQALLYTIAAITSVVSVILFVFPGPLSDTTFSAVGNNFLSLVNTLFSNGVLLYLSFVNPIAIQTQISTKQFVLEQYSNSRQVAISLAVIALGLAGVSSIMGEKAQKTLSVGTSLAFIFSTLSYSKIIPSNTLEGYTNNQMITEQFLCVSIGILLWTFMTVATTTVYENLLQSRAEVLANSWNASSSRASSQQKRAARPRQVDRPVEDDVVRRMRYTNPNTIVVSTN